MSAEKIIADWKKKSFKPIYWLEGEESFYIDQVIDFAEHHLLPESEAAFNLSVFYGKDANWTEVINACRRYPMFAERQVVLLKEAQQMRDVEKLEPYIANPLTSTILVVAHKEKKVDGRSKLAKYLKQNAVMVTTKKMYDSQLPEWTNDLVQSKGYSISQKALMLLVDHIGNDISRINNEIDKLLLNIGSRKNISEEDIEAYVGVSKEYNVFELQEALQRKDLAKAMRILQYFESNPKAAPIQLLLPSLYNFFSKVYMLFSVQGADDKTASAAIGVNPFFMKDYKLAARNYGYNGTENTLLLLHHYNLRSIGIHDAGTEDASLMKEMIVKMMM
ncbi:MAG: DNA polymerase III subunit delta [Agriterribacter sp.]